MAAVEPAAESFAALTASWRTTKQAKRSNPGSTAWPSGMLTETGRRPQLLPSRMTSSSSLVRQRVALAPAAGRAKRELASCPLDRPASAEIAWPELADDVPRRVRGLHHSLPEAAADELPVVTARFGVCATCKEAFEVNRADALQCVAAAVTGRADELELCHRFPLA